MEVTMTGGRLFAGAPISEVHNSGGVGRLGGLVCTVDDNKSSGVGLSAVIERFTLDVPCNCALQPGDWIEISSVVILFVEVGEVSYHLCGGACVGKKSVDFRGVGIGLEKSTIHWVCR